MVAGTLRKFVDMISDMIFEIEHLLSPELRRRLTQTLVFLKFSHI